MPRLTFLLSTLSWHVGDITAAYIYSPSLSGSATQQLRKEEPSGDLRCDLHPLLTFQCSPTSLHSGVEPVKATQSKNRGEGDFAFLFLFFFFPPTHRTYLPKTALRFGNCRPSFRFRHSFRLEQYSKHRQTEGGIRNKDDDEGERDISNLGVEIKRTIIGEGHQAIYS